MLLDSDLRADFGNSRILDLDPSATPQTLTSVPGTLEYMPPEALGRNTKYLTNLDVFSLGHLSLFTIVQTEVPPLPPTYLDDEGMVHGLTEIQRREEFMRSAEQLLSEIPSGDNGVRSKPAQRPRTGDLVMNLRAMGE